MLMIILPVDPQLEPQLSLTQRLYPYTLTPKREGKRLNHLIGPVNATK
jgi:hypothetical protein